MDISSIYGYGDVDERYWHDAGKRLETKGQKFDSLQIELRRLDLTTLQNVSSSHQYIDILSSPYINLQSYSISTSPPHHPVLERFEK